MNRKELITNPTPELLDLALLEIIDKNNEHIEAYGEHHTYEQEMNREVDELLEDSDLKHRTKAEQKYRTLKPQAYEKQMQLYRKKKRLEAELSQLKMNYYHAREKIQEHRQEDVNASLHGELFN